MAKHVIELNGLQYDALTGKPLSKSAGKASATPRSATSSPKHLDGFTRRPRTVTSQTVSYSVHKKTQKSQTLMRTVVKKPTTTKIQAKVTAQPSEVKKQTPASIIQSQKPGRVIRAGVISQSDLISKFGKTPAPIKTEVLHVKSAPSEHVNTTKNPTSDMKTTVSQFQAPIAPISTKSAHSILDEAIERATSHDQPHARKMSLNHRIAQKLHVTPRFVSLAGSSLAVLVIAGFVAYQNMPEFAMKIASTRAGLNASLPSYQPAGFALAGPIKYDHGEVTINYKSNSDDRAFDVTQKNSEWNSEALLENFVTATKQPYQTFQANGRTIYIYDGNKATWVDGGVWFNIDGKTNLNSDQLLRIADSL